MIFPPGNLNINLDNCSPVLLHFLCKTTPRKNKSINGYLLLDVLLFKKGNLRQ